MTDEHRVAGEPSTNEESSAAPGRRDFLKRLGVSAAGVGVLQGTAASPAIADLETGLNEMVAKMGDQFDGFPEGGVDGFLSHFIIMLEFLKGPMAGRTLTVEMPTAVQTVSRSQPFVYRGSEAGHSVKVPIPSGCSLSDTITERDFLHRPAEFFQQGRETVWMQILNLDARVRSAELGPIRIILGETLKKEYPEIFLPSLGIAQSLGTSRFPARLYFNPYAVIETSMGAFRAIHGTLSYGRVTSFPPIGTPVSICECIPLESVENVRKSKQLREITGDPPARIIALTHPIDVKMQVSGAEAFRLVESLARGGTVTR
jgi:hypothetical protein